MLMGELHIIMLMARRNTNNYVNEWNTHNDGNG